jgi:Zn-finger nucleic acid-binding protein
MNCPRCTAALREAKVDEVVLDRCAGCGGIWLDFAQLDRVLSRESRALKEILPQGPHHHPEGEGPLSCPRCQGTLIRMRTSPDPVTYYACLTCYGRWLDGNELERIVGRPLTAKFERLFQRLLD